MTEHCEILGRKWHSIVRESRVSAGRAEGLWGCGCAAMGGRWGRQRLQRRPRLLLLQRRARGEGQVQLRIPVGLTLLRRSPGRSCTAGASCDSTRTTCRDTPPIWFVCMSQCSDADGCGGDVRQLQPGPGTDEARSACPSLLLTPSLSHVLKFGMARRGQGKW
jgi:hypothetical protein